MNKSIRIFIAGIVVVLSVAYNYSMPFRYGENEYTGMKIFGWRMAYLFNHDSDAAYKLGVYNLWESNRKEMCMWLNRAKEAGFSASQKDVQYLEYLLSEKCSSINGDSIDFNHLK